MHVHLQKAYQFANKLLLYVKNTYIKIIALTLLEIVGFPHVYAHQGHELQLRQPLPGRRRQGQQVPEVRDFRVDQVPSQFARPFRRLGRVEPARNKTRSTQLIYVIQL